MKLTLFVLLAMFLVFSCDSTSNNLTMPTEPQVMAKTVNDMDTFVSLSKKGKGPFKKTTGDLQATLRSGKNINWIFNAHQLDAIEVDGNGKGKATSIRSLDSVVDRTREFNIEHVNIFDNKGKLALHCTFDSDGLSTDGWFFIYVVDEGEPGVGIDKYKYAGKKAGLPYTRESVIIDVNNPGFIPSVNVNFIEEGNIQVHTYN